MKFLIEDSDTVADKELVYLIDECSFYMGKINHDVDVEWILNKISLASSDNTIIHISGFCGLSISMNSNICVPEYSKGRLKVEHNLKKGFAYGIYDDDQPIHLNTKSGWVCIGDPLKLGKAVEFIQNCVAVINSDGQLLSLWLKPKSLPVFEEKSIKEASD